MSVKLEYLKRVVFFIVLIFSVLQCFDSRKQDLHARILHGYLDDCCGSTVFVSYMCFQYADVVTAYQHIQKCSSLGCLDFMASLISSQMLATIFYPFNIRGFDDDQVVTCIFDPEFWRNPCLPKNQQLEL